MAPQFPKNPSRSYGAAPKGDSVHGPGWGNAPTTAGLWGLGAPGSTKTEEQKAPCWRCCAQRQLQVWSCCSGCGRIGPCQPRCPKSGLLSTACSPSLQNHQHFPRSGSGSRKRDVDVWGARQDLSGNGEGAPTAPAPAWAQPGQRQPCASLQPGWETVAKDVAGRPPPLPHPAFASCHLRAEGIGKHSWNHGSAPCGRTGQVRERPSRRCWGFGHAWHTNPLLF